MSKFLIETVEGFIFTVEAVSMRSAVAEIRDRGYSVQRVESLA